MPLWLLILDKIDVFNFISNKTDIPQMNQYFWTICVCV